MIELFKCFGQNQSKWYKYENITEQILKTVHRLIISDIHCYRLKWNKIGWWYAISDKSFSPTLRNRKKFWDGIFKNDQFDDYNTVKEKTNSPSLFLFQYLTSIRESPNAGTNGPAFSRIPDFMITGMSSGWMFPFPISNSVPVNILTMWCKKPFPE